MVNKAYYFLITLGLTTDDKIILFQSYMGQSYACSPKALYIQICQMDEFKDFTLVWAFRNPDEKVDPDLIKCKKVKYFSTEYFRYLGKSKYWIVNVRVPDHVIKKKDQIYVQCWHGTPLKKLGFDIDDGNNAVYTKKEMADKYANDAKKHNFFLSPSAFASEKFRSAFNLNQLHNHDIIIEEGYPRNDFLFLYNESDVKKIKNKLNIPENKKVILYAPTWRDNQYKSGYGYTYSLNVNFDLWREKLKEDYIVLFRAHNHVTNNFDFAKYEDFIYDVTQIDDVNDCYIISDLLITDYSSVFFDYANLRRPILFYMYDLDEYKDRMRGFYIDLNELPGPIIENEMDLISYILSSSEIDNQEKFDRFNNKYNYLDDFDSSRRVIKKIIQV
ncbi:MAG: CDP-glycerol glycerophosphotransferase family protein [Spirochaetales bacterium]|nr:CDP-glycerol glycerophosphotransferase family protein [Spirochaetales bacterium]